MDQLFPIDSERVVLGSLILHDGESLPLVESVLTVEDFCSEQHKNIFRWIQLQVNSKSPVDISVLGEKEGSSQVTDKYGGIGYLQSLGDRAVLEAQISGYANVVADSARLRRINEATELIRNKIREGTESVDVIKAYAEEQILGAKVDLGVGAVINADEVSQNAMAKFDGMVAGESSANEYIKSGLPTLDRHYLGWPRGLPSYIGGRSKMGKTAFMLACAIKGALLGIPQGIISIEMGKTKLAYRIASYFSGVSLREALQGDDEQKRWFRWGLEKLSELPLFIDDASRNINVVASAIRQMKRKHGCETVYIDYVQLITGYGRSGDERTRLDAVADTVRQVAKEENIAIVALAQFNRMLDARTTGGRKGVPCAGDFRGSDKFLHDAGLAFGVYRPFYYQPPVKVGCSDRYTDEELSSMFQPLEIISLAARESARLDLPLVLQTGWGRIYDVDEPCPDWWSGTWPPAWS